MSASIERKCPYCNTWNKNLEFCSKCHEPISLQQIDKKNDAIKATIAKNKPKDKADIVLEQLRYHPFFLVRWIFILINSVFVFFMAIGSLVAYFIAWAAS